MKKLVVFTGSGVSAESGIRTFRDSGGLWENYNVMEVATPQAWEADPLKVQQFYNERRKQVLGASPNDAHHALKLLESKYSVTIITQNIDDLHERAGSTNVLHLHGEITKARSSRYPELIYPVEGDEISMEARCEKGFPLRPFIVWFGEPVPMMDKAIMKVAQADIFIIIGTSLEVYPAASLIDFAKEEAEKYFIDPGASEKGHLPNMTIIASTAGKAVPALVKKLLA